ncbi:class I SAM-dependent methyltransferase [Verrucosispora sp. WMMA2044]|uniref:Class I SAM-dependent methyltransferase n=1 Tax=Verrucosispora sioxanthis TaxID=2499994 RepID=A0A6M1LCC0_9ACTN|nr:MULTISPECIES: class I SAM-dependent methyltransferase [Micromonospora]NEE66749.1 class I SAM-dependent methyltransferase [Verrucosispora sioxanthis]NGM15859.1 class I SAM-dependent methyltransferase [Verrucosispora sioxanthis]WBB48517.1 class I SAM-dependent methyltransferase [Verrucosispora sp. WMMA2044]
MGDEYAISGEYLHVLSEPAWHALRTPVTEALRGAVGDGTLLDVGAGTGLGTEVLATAVPDADVFAVEPSPVLRAVLLSRMAARPDLRRRVTVVAADALGADLPARLGAVLAMNMIGHLDPDGRRTFLRRVAERLAPGAPLVLNLQPPAEPTPVPFAVFGTVSVGRHTYEGGGSAEPSGPDTVTWKMQYRMLDADDTVLREDHADYGWHVISAEALLADLAEAGLSGEFGSLDVVRAVRRS